MFGWVSLVSLLGGAFLLGTWVQCWHPLCDYHRLALLPVRHGSCVLGAGGSVVSFLGGCFMVSCFHWGGGVGFIDVSGVVGRGLRGRLAIRLAGVG